MRFYSESGQCSVYYIDGKGQEYGPMDVNLRLGRKFESIQEYREAVATFVSNLMKLVFSIPEENLVYKFDDTSIHRLQ